jgi:pyruvate ferredoxin oxidoreductase alpha subunit
VQAALADARQVLVLEKSLAPGMGGAVSSDIQTALAGTDTKISTVIAGLGGRPITKASLRRLFDRSALGKLKTLDFMDLNPQLVTG